MQFAALESEVVVGDLPFSVGDLPFSVEEKNTKIYKSCRSYTLKQLPSYISYITFIIV